MYQVGIIKSLNFRSAVEWAKRCKYKLVYEKGFIKTHGYKLDDRNPSFAQMEHFDKPDNLELMLDIAKKLSQGFDYVRIDLYNIKGKVFFGEITQTHAAGMSKFVPSVADYYRGQLWKLEETNRDLYIAR